MDESNDIVRELMENFKKLTVSTTSKVKPRQGKQKKIIWTGNPPLNKTSRSHGFVYQLCSYMISA